MVVFQEKSNSLDLPEKAKFGSLIILGQQATSNAWPNE